MWSDATSPTPAFQVIRACLQSASALHTRQLVHQDFRYANVLWDTEGPFVIDLDMAATLLLKMRHLSSCFSSFHNRCRALLHCCACIMSCIMSCCASVVCHGVWPCVIRGRVMQPSHVQLSVQLSVSSDVLLML